MASQAVGIVFIFLDRSVDLNFPFQVLARFYLHLALPVISR